MADDKIPIQDAEEEERFLFYLDGNMSPQEREGFEADLARDAGLKERFDAYEGATSLLHRLSEQDEPVDLLPNLERRMGLRRRPAPGLAWRIPLEVGGMLAVMLAAVLLFMHGLKQEGVTLPVQSPGPVEIFLKAGPPEGVLERFQIGVTGASQGTAQQVFVGRLPNAEVQKLLDALGPAVDRVRWYPNNPCEPCAVLLFDVTSKPENPPK